MADLLFGTAGIPLSTWPQTTINGIHRVSKLGLDCMELEFVQGIYLKEGEAILVAKAAQQVKIKLSVHAPYFLNFNAHQPQKLRASQGILLKTARIASICGADNVIFHAGFYLGDSPQQTYQVIKKSLLEVVAKVNEGNIKLWFRPEVSGKGSQFGNLDELMRLSTEIEGVAPCIDFAHLHARSGVFNSYPEFIAILEQMNDRLGGDALKNMHIHISGIEYGSKGERKHLELRKSDLQYKELLRALVDYNVKGSIICESPNREDDALLLKTNYNTL
jgi:deoxyribonuclease-4